MNTIKFSDHFISLEKLNPHKPTTSTTISSIQEIQISGPNPYMTAIPVQT